MKNMIEEDLNRHFGFNGFRKGQKEVIEKIMGGKSAAAIFPTGAGKSLCYQLPALLLPGLTLVVSPLLSLMKDQLDFLVSKNIPAARLDSTLSGEQYSSVINRAVQGELKILMISVERFRNERFRNQLGNMNISLLAIDEAHCISEWGHNFRPEYLRLPDYRKEFAIKQVLLLTATATQKVTEDMRGKFGIEQENVVTTGFYRDNLFLKITPLVHSRKREKLLNDLKQAGIDSVIVYVTLQKTAESLALWLKEEGISAAFYHGGMKSDERTDVQNRFMAGQLNCVVATIAFGMGIDKKDIRRVIHFDLPKSIENYSQEIGRAGRDGQLSLCEVYGDRSNLPILENFIYGDTPDRDSIGTVLTQIKDNGSLWEIKLPALSRESNIRQLPLKTLLVYLSMMGIIEPKHTYFEEYVFKYLEKREEIISRFEGERKHFVRSIFENSVSKKVWTTVDMEAICSTNHMDRSRVLKALDYFHEKQWIDLTARQAVEVYHVPDSGFDMQQIEEKLYSLFLHKEKTEIERIHNMVNFFEKDSCISRELALYFGEQIEKEKCGHCSFCESGSVKLTDESDLPPLSTVNISGLLSEIISTAGSRATIGNLTKFLCGITTPLFVTVKAKSMKGFGKLERYPFREVRETVRQSLSPAGN